MKNYDFGLEKRLAELNPELSKRYAGCMFLFENMLKNYTAQFPHFTDHTLLHSMNVGNYSNMLLRDNIELFNADEIYCYLMGVLIHDVGMGINESGYQEFSHTLGIEKLIAEHPEWKEADVIRKFHNDFSYCFTMKFWQLFDIPDESYATAIAYIGRAHRKVDLLDEQITPSIFTLDNGSQVHLPVLGALIRVADELDMGSDRNPDLLYDNNFEGREGEGEYIIHMKRHQTIDSIDVEEEEIVFSTNNKYPEVRQALLECVDEVYTKLKLYVKVAAERPCIKTTQKRIVVKCDGKEDVILEV